MRGRGNRLVHTRAIIALVALYALVFQAFFTNATAAPSPEFIGVVCAHDETQAPSGGDPAKHAHPCCTAACSAQTAFKAAVPGASVSVVGRQATTVAWQPEAAAVPHPISVRSASARGPPSV